MIKYATILSEVTRTPWAILPSKLTAITNFLAIKAAGKDVEEAEILALVEAAKSRNTQARAVGDVAIIPILGTIINRGNNFREASGATSVAATRQSLKKAMNDKDVGSVLLDIDSPGGSVEGITELAADIRRSRNQKPILAHIDGLGASASYWLASQASKITMTPSSEVGSIGVITAHTDLSEALAKEGVKPTLITAGDYKAEANPFEPLTDEAREELQAGVDHFFDLFVGDVAKGRAVGKKVVKADFGKGRLLRAPQAAEVGMVDGIETSEEALSTAVLMGNAQAKAAGITDIKQFESFLRDAGFSKAAARRVACHGFEDRCDADQTPEMLKRVKDNLMKGIPQ